jgi:hypothetical protein
MCLSTSKTRSELLSEIAKVLPPDGSLVLIVPAYQWLWSAQDQTLGHFRCYSTTTLRATLATSGFSVLLARYCFASLVPAAALLRTLPYRLGRRKKDDEILARNWGRLNPGTVANCCAGTILALEARVSRRVPLPFGLSIVAFARPELGIR